MKTSIKIFQLVLLMLFCNILFAQNSNGLYSKLNKETLNQNNLNFKAAIANNNSSNLSSYNTVFIRQIGNNNDIVSNSQAINKNINLYQYGDENKIDLKIKAKKIDEIVIQRGFSNSFLDLNLNGNFSHKTTAIQIGKNQNLLLAGNNSISQKMIVNMKGKGQTILIRNSSMK
jgi:hypothetical protein